MVSTKRKHFNPLDSEHSPSPRIFETLLSAIEAPEGVKPPLLKSLYFMLINLSSNPRYCAKKGADLKELVVEIGQYVIRVTIEDICRLSDILFKELCKRFKQLLSTVNDISASRRLGEASLHPDMRATAEELNLLLRCCMIILSLLEQHLLLENGRVLLAILRKLSLLELTGGNEKNVINFDQLLSRECTFSDNGCTMSFTEEFVVSLSFLEPSDPCIPFLSAILEVFLDELLVHGKLREFFKLIDSVSSSSEMLFMRHSSNSDIAVVMEVISTHFFLSISDEQAFEDFFNQLSWPHGKHFIAPELSPTAAISLLLNPIMVCAPKFMQAHMVSLVSEAVDIGIGLEDLKPDLRFMDRCLSVFGRSVILYTKHMSGLQMDGHPEGARGGSVKSSICGEYFQPSFESFIQPVTRKKINHLITKLDASWHSHLQNMFFRTKSDLVTSSMAYIKESQDKLDISCRDDILSILSCIILRAPGNVNDIALQTNGDTSLQDICLLASLLKLMSSSLLQAVWCLRHSGNLDCPKTLKNFSSCKEYDSIVGIISCFREFNIGLPIQKSLGNMMETHPTRHKESKLMLFHFLGLLSLSFVSGLGFLVKGCLLTIMALMNLFVFEEGNLDALRSLFDSRLDSAFGLSVANVQEIAAGQKSSLVVAAKFQKIQTSHLSTGSLASDSTGMEDMQPENLASSLIPDNMERVVGIVEETEEMINGQIFLKTILQGPGKSSDLDDLADFIECKRGKDYSGWLKDRQKYRNWKCEKRAVLRWEKKKKTWKFMKGKKIGKR